MAMAIARNNAAMAREMEKAMAKQQGGGAAGGGRSDSNWEGMLEWFRPEDQSDGVLRTAHSDGTPRPAPKWRGEAKKLFMISKPPREDYDIDDRAYDIAGSLMVPAEVQSYTPRKIQDLLDELQAYVEFIDVASVLHSDDRLFPLLLKVLFNDHVNVRAKAAEFVTTMVQNNPTSQQVVLDINGLHFLLYNLNSDPDAISRTKALGAISALIRNNKPAITAFRLEGGYAALKKAALDSESVMLQRDALNLIQYLLHENSSSDCNIVTELEFPGIMMELASSDDAEVREAALRGLLVIIKDEGGNSGQLVKNDDKLKQVLQKLIQRISAMAPEDLGVAREEIQLVDSLWNACYNEPSSVGEKGLLVLPGEDGPAPDVASKLFEPPLRALAAAEVVDGNSSEKEDPLLLGLCPPSAATPTYQSN